LVFVLDVCVRVWCVCVRVWVCVCVCVCVGVFCGCVVMYLWNFLNGLQSQVDVKLILPCDICMVVTNGIKQQPERNRNKSLAFVAVINRLEGNKCGMPP